MELSDQQIIDIFKALADPSRLRLLYALAEEEMCVCDLSALLEITESAVSHQLRLLRTLQIVANRREGTVLYYRLKDHHVSELIALSAVVVGSTGMAPLSRHNSRTRLAASTTTMLSRRFWMM